MVNIKFEKCVHKLRQASIIVFTSPSNEKLQQNCKTRLYVRKNKLLHTVKIIAVRCQVTIKYTSITLLSETFVNQGRASVMTWLNCVRKVPRLGQYLGRVTQSKSARTFFTLLSDRLADTSFETGLLSNPCPIPLAGSVIHRRN